LEELLPPSSGLKMEVVCPQGVTTQKTNINIFSTLKTSNLKKENLSFCRESDNILPNRSQSLTAISQITDHRLLTI
jgi:hypothetical protein